MKTHTEKKQTQANTLCTHRVVKHTLKP